MLCDSSTFLNSCGLVDKKVKLREKNHIKVCKFISKVFADVPFLYEDSDTEDYYWRKVATELNPEEEGLGFYFCGKNDHQEKNSFGSVVNHIKYNFYRLMLANDRSGNHSLTYPSFEHNEEHFEGVKIRSKPVNEFYRYFLPEEIRSMIIAGIFDQETNKNKPLSETGHKYDQESECSKSHLNLSISYGVLFSMEETNYRTVYMKLKTNQMKLEFLKLLPKLHLLNEMIPSYVNVWNKEKYVYEKNITGYSCLSDMISKKSNQLMTIDIPQLAKMLNNQIEELKTDKGFSYKKIASRLLAVEHLEKYAIILEGVDYDLW